MTLLLMPLDKCIFFVSERFQCLPFQEWPEEAYPPYANGPGYVVSSDIASFIVSEFEKQKLRVRIFILLCFGHSGTVNFFRQA